LEKEMILKDRVAIVTGAGKGLGRAFSIKLAEEGAKVLAVTRSDIDGLKETVRIIKENGGDAEWLKVDVTNHEDVDTMAKKAVSTFGGIDILVNNAAYYYGVKRRPFYEIEPQEWDRMMAVNVKGAWMCIKAVFPSMKERGKGKIVNLSSETFFTGSHGFVHYVSSKGAIVGLTRALAIELGPYNICINAVAPGFTDTEASASIADISKYDVSRTPLKRLEKPEDLTGVMAFLCSDASDFITGQTILVDGGRAKH